ncbi:hypothetical protein MRB53_026763 [Persea americana]|uniref:Uncharacterized protein n=1 Tax=Persea americana TaxID=3435 RepID=A0ACC2LJ49_PERAE|nr:hypothetical protein MRB53_026763 [Persea americana]
MQDENKNLNGVGLIRIILEWAVAPPIAGVMAFCFFAFLKIAVLRKENAEKRMLIFLPICYGILAGLLCLFLMDQVIPRIVTTEAWESTLAVILATIIAALLSLLVVVPLARRRWNAIERTSIRKGNKSQKHISAKSPNQAPNDETDDQEKIENAIKEYMEMRVLETIYEEDEKSCASQVTTPDANNVSPMTTSFMAPKQSSAPLKQLLESTPNRLIQTRNFQKINKTTSRDNFSNFFEALKSSTISPGIEYGRHTLVRHALAEKFDEKIEDLFSFPQLFAACIFALSQSANEIGAVVSPYEAIHDIFKYRAKYSGNEDVGLIQGTCWLRAVGGFAASIGFFLCGWRLTQGLGGKLTYVSNCRGFCSQFCAVATMILVNRLNLPVSSTHSFIGSILGVGIADDPSVSSSLCAFLITYN